MKISIVICTYHPDKYFIKQIKSIIDSIDNIDPSLEVELIISDDSRDGKVKSLIKSFDLDWHYLKGPSTGKASDNFLYALSHVTGDWIFLSDQDDTWERNKIQEYLKVIDHLEHYIPQIIFSDAKVIGENDNLISKSFFEYQGLSTKTLHRDDILFINCVQGATLCINNKMVELLNKTVTRNDYNKIIMHDWWIAILARYCGNWTFINKPLINYRQHGKNQIGATRKSSFIIMFLKSPFSYLLKLQEVKEQYKLWCHVSNDLGFLSTFNSKKIALLALAARIKSIIIKFL